MSKKNGPEDKNQEKVLVVPRDVLFPDGAYAGLREEDIERVLELITKNAQFLPRAEVENNPSFKQIIPYLVFLHQGKVFLMQRNEDHTEARLANRYSLGIGGHIQRHEFIGKDIFAWAQREFGEEVDYEGNFKIKLLGLLNDESDGVGQVHTGLVLLLEGDRPEIQVKDEHKSGKLVSLEECRQYYPQMENWSQIILPVLREVV